MMHKQWTYLRAFTLAELIITLAVIGSVSIALVPMISSSMAGPQRFRASLRTLITQMETALQSNDIQRGATNNFQVFTAALRPQRTCPNNSSKEGCWNITTQGGATGSYNTESNQLGMILKNGASISGLDNNAIGFNSFVVDVNGIDGPNQPNVDQLALLVCLTEASCTLYNAPEPTFNPDADGTYKATVGGILPFPNSMVTGNATRFNELME